MTSMPVRGVGGEDTTATKEEALGIGFQDK
jgi:hypothetical protein